MNLEKNSVDPAAFAQRLQEGFLCPLMRFVGGPAGETGEDKVERQNLPVARGRARDESRDWIFAAGESQHGISREHRALKEFEAHALSSESIRRNQVTA